MSLSARTDQDQTFRHPWFPSRPNAVGNDGIGDQFTAPLFPAQQSSGVYLSAGASKVSPPPPQRSQPDGSELRQRLVVKTSVVTPAVPMPSQMDKHKASVSTDKSLAKNGVQAVQRQHVTAHAESPVSQLLGPNFKAAQQVLNLLKQDRLLGKGSEDVTSSLSDKAPDVTPIGSLSETAVPESGASSGGSYSTSQRVDRPRLEEPYSHSTPSSDDTAYSHTGIGAQILQEMEQRYGASSTEHIGEQRYGATEDHGHRYGASSTEDSGQRYGTTEDRAQGHGALSTEDSRNRYGASSTEDSGQRYGALSTGDRGQRYGALSTEGSGHRYGASEDSGHRYGASEDNAQRYGTLPTEDRRQSCGATEDRGQRYDALSAENNEHRYGALSTDDRGQRYTALSAEDSGLKLEDSRRSSSNASLGLDNPANSPHSVENTHRAPERLHYSSSAHAASDASSNDTDDLLNYDAAIESDLQYLAEQRERNFTTSSQPGRSRGSSDESKRRASTDSSAFSLGRGQLQETLDPGREDDLTQYHMSLGAGVVTPLQDEETPESTTRARSLPKDSSSSQESLKVQDIEDGDTDDSPSSTELYQPVLAGPRASQAASYGIYDIRRSSGPGSTNRRRRAMGLDPLSSRKERNDKSNDTVYVSGGSTPVAIDNARVMSVDSVRSTSSTEPDRFERAPTPQDSITETPRAVERFQKGPPGHTRVYTANSSERPEESLRVDSRVYRAKGRTDSSISNGSLASGVSGRKDSLPASAVDRKQTISSRTSDSHRRKKEWMPGFTPSTGKSLEDSVALSGGDGRFSTQRRHERLQAPKRSSRLERASSKTPYGYESDTLTSGTDSVASNISKLSQMIFRPLSERSSLSSQTSLSTPVENARPLRDRLVVSSSSEPSSTSGSFNSAFVDPKLSPSVEQQLRLRELLKNLGSCQAVGSRLIPALVDESSTEAESLRVQMPSSRRGKQKKLTESVQVKILSPKKEKQKRTVKPPFVKDRRETAGQCICGLQEKARTKEQEGSGGRNKDVYTAVRPTRDVAVSCSPDQEITIAKEGRRMEDACTQTDVMAERVERAAQKSRTERHIHETEADRRPVLLTPPHKKAASRKHLTRKDPLQSNSPEKERLVASENAPLPLSPTAAKHARKQGPAWFCSVSNEHFSKTDSTRLDNFQVDLGARVQVPQSLQKLTLQEAFMTAKPDFVQRSRARLLQVKEAAKSPRKPSHDTADKENATAVNKSPTNSGKSSSSANKVHQNCGK